MSSAKAWGCVLIAVIFIGVLVVLPISLSTRDIHAIRFKSPSNISFLPPNIYKSPLF